MNRELWQQAIRLARALEHATKAENSTAAKIHHKALLDVLRAIIKMESENEKTRK